MILLLSCDANRWKWPRIIDGWLAHCGIPYVIVVGTGLQDRKEGPVAASFDEATRELRLDCDDGYDGLSYKVAHGIREIVGRFTPEFLIKVDDDIVLKPRMLLRYTEICRAARLDYCGNASARGGPGYSVHGIAKFRWPENKLPLLLPSNSTCVGPLYYLSATSLRVLAAHMVPGSCRCEDVNVSLTLEANGILADSMPVYTEIWQQYAEGFAVAFHDDTRAHPQNICPACPAGRAEPV